ncbi:MAG: polynucleotide adenylyltransferase PcnB [Bdellovibrionales bacterium]|nr:polynucleotide adenylyltransferase PcnB [Bdellovibrionales bacterium]
MKKDKSLNVAKPKVYSRKEHIISRKNIDPDALKIMYRLNRYGYKAYLVGGGVRDLLLKKAPKDFDIATNATPRQIKSLFRNSRIIGRRFKLIHVFFKNGKIIEVSTFRDTQNEIESNSGNQTQKDNTYGTEATDAFRRDLTINALFYSTDNFSIIDYVGGIEDLDNEIIRMIGDPNQRLPEDPVRLMRVIRHAVKANFKIESNLEKALKKHSKLIVDSSPMRVYEELRKDFASGYCLDIFRGLKKYSILQYLLPELCNSPKLLTPQSLLSDSIEIVDQYSLIQGKQVSTTAFLSILFLFHGLDQTLEIKKIDTFPSKEVICDLSQQSFKTLAIPRKERERIEKTILLWKYLIETPIEKLKVNSLTSRSAIDDLRDIFEVLYRDTRPELTDLVEKILNKKVTKGRNSTIRTNKTRKATKNTSKKKQRKSARRGTK